MHTDRTIINAGRILNMEEMRKNPNIMFSDTAVDVETYSNNGKISMFSKEYMNKCFFISIVHGFRLNDIKLKINNLPNIDTSYMNVIDIDNYYAYKLAESHRMLNNVMIDTNNPLHAKIIEKIAQDNGVTLAFFYGSYNHKSRGWKTAPNPWINFGTGRTVIKILNKPNHFEYIISCDSIDDLTKSRFDSVINRQGELLNDFRRKKEQEQNDYKLARELYNNYG